MGRVIAIGEALIDFIPGQKNCLLKDIKEFVKKPGGAPANVAACVSKLGGKSMLITQVGKDAFGEYLIETLFKAGVDTKAILQTHKANTALAFVSLQENGERDFSFYRKPSADMLLDEQDIDEEWFDKDDLLHFCSVDLIDAPVKKAHIKALKIAREKGCIVCFDPNVRLPLWESKEECKNTIKEFLLYADILKVSEEELEFITDLKEEKAAVKALFHKRLQLLLVSKGEKGVSVYYQGGSLGVPAFSIHAVDTTGAGDAFVGGFLYQLSLLNNNFLKEDIDKDKLYDILSFANGVGGITASRYGAISALPSYQEVIEFIKK